MKRETFLRALLLVLGFWVTAMGASFFIGSNLGSDSFTLTTIGFAKLMHISIGAASSLLSAVVMVAVFLVDRSYVKVGTLLSLAVLGPGIDFWLMVCAPIHRALNQNYLLQLVCIAIAIVVAALGISIVMSADFGTHINDAVPVLLSKTVCKRWQFRVSKILWDFSQIGVAMLLGVMFGVGTILSAIFFGPILQFFIPITRGVVTKYILKTAT